MIYNDTYPFNFYDLINRKYINHSPSLKYENNINSLEELWSHYPEIFNCYNINNFKDIEKEILFIVNNKDFYNNKYLLDYNKSCILCNDNINEYINNNNINIKNIISNELYNASNALLTFLELYYVQLIHKLFKEEFGGPNRMLLYETEIYLENLANSFINLNKILNVNK